MKDNLPIFKKAVLINVSILMGLLFEYYVGQPLKVVVACGVFIFAFANGLMYFKHRKATQTRIVSR